MPTQSVTGRDVVSRLIQFIRENQMRAGDRLPAIPRLAQEWQVKPSIVRDGLLQAQSLGLVRIDPRLGTFVQQPDLSPLVSTLSETLDLALMMDDRNLVHLGEARIMAEKETAAAAARRAQPEDLLQIRECLEDLQRAVSDRSAFVEADERFHVAIATAAGNPVMTSFVRALLIALRPYRLRTLVTEDDARKTAEGHVSIYQALVDGDADRARREMEAHFSNARRLISQHLGMEPRDDRDPDR